LGIKDGRGYSQATLDKEDGLEKILSLHIDIVKKILRKERNSWIPKCYFFIDAYAGPGENPEVECKGSPLIYLDTIANKDLKSKAWFIDVERKNTMLLKIRIDDNQAYSGLDYTILTGDNKFLVPRVAAGLPKHALGLIYADATNIPDFDMLGTLSKIEALKMFDILIRYPATNIKRTQHLTGLQMRDYLRKVQKKHWIIRDILPGDKFQWTFLLGMNFEISDWKKERFYKVDSEEGKLIFDRCNNMRHPNGPM
jgi:three-Cys-motif partner protein